MDAPLPPEWRHSVCRILSSHTLANVIVRQRALRDWQSLFPGAFPHDLLDAFLKALRNPSQTGRLVSSMEEPGMVYEFIFEHEERLVYGKMNLRSDGNVVIVYSAHRPLKGDTL